MPISKTSEVPNQDPREGRSVGLGLTALSLSVLMSTLGTSIANVGLPTFAHAFDASFLPAAADRKAN